MYVTTAMETTVSAWFQCAKQIFNQRYSNMFNSFFDYLESTEKKMQGKNGRSAGKY